MLSDHRLPPIHHRVGQYLRVTFYWCIIRPEQWPSPSPRNRNPHESETADLLRWPRQPSREIRSPDHFLFVDFPPNSGSANVGRVFAHTGSIVWHHVMPVSVEVVVMKLHLIRRRKLWSSVVRAVSALNSHVGLEAHLRRQPTKKRKRPWCRSFFALVEVVVALVLVLHNNQRAGSGL